MVDGTKAKGNAAFPTGDFTTAVRHFSVALAPFNHHWTLHRGFGQQKYPAAMNTEAIKRNPKDDPKVIILIDKRS
ncbi:unnamed protein product [Sphenostylis stenocarpa]|uniref:Uncharacterized protein n=1 Tax=Sphenostylis stenocarpa TaxID=92480 RepID=A0AA86SYK1_9FABA|nr:unnamed protein product [Sphenostylis stenocarpa]